ncbi:unannotated protein [freshwater metagenome]|uniref:Unannotated protein n=1 Tax=freshwater metagenome TaxID=449393 RepID=A0A6J6L811_9ZZZZ|nr:thiol reductant ABC exporter subunit CydD [Actinomycetota bacterium]
MKSSDLRLLLTASGSRRLLSVGIFAAVMWATILIANAVLIAEVIIGIISHAPGVNHSIILLALLWVLRALFNAGFEHWTSSQAVTIKRNLRNSTTSKVATYSGTSPAQLSTVLTKGLNGLDIYLGRFIPQMIFASIVPFAVMATMFLEDRLSAFIALVTLPLIPFFGALIGRYSADSVARKWQSLGTLSRYFEDSLRGFATLKIFGRSHSQSKRIGVMGQKYTDETMQVLKISFISAFALELVATISVAVVAVSVGLRLVSGSMDFKPALIVLILAPEVYFPVRNAASLFHASEDGTEALRQIAIVRGALSQEVAQSSEAIERNDVTSIHWSDWEFAKGAIETVVVPGSRVKAGELTFIIGESGIGKTTFAKNLLGMTHSANLCVTTNKGDIAITPEKTDVWQKLIGWIPQNPQLASGTVRDQFILLSPSLSDADIERALEAAGLSLSDLPNGLETKIAGGEQGNSASGGQIRRIAVARALIRNPLLIIADEPTADLDQESANHVMRALRSAQEAGAIVIAITHDTSAMVAGDRILRVIRK